MNPAEKAKLKTFYWSIFSWFYLIGGEGEYGQVYNWFEGEREKTEGDLERGFAGRPDLQAWIRDRRTHYEKLLERYSGEQLRRTEERLRTSLFQKVFPLKPVSFWEIFRNTLIKGATGYPWLSHYSLCYLNETTWLIPCFKYKLPPVIRDGREWVPVGMEETWKNCTEI